MSDDLAEQPVEINRTKVRTGLALISLLFAASVVLLFVVDDRIGKAIFFAVALLALVRIALLVRWLKRRDDVMPTLA